MIANVTELQHDLSEDLFTRLTGCYRVAWDIETTGLDWRQGRIGTCQLHSDETGTVVVQLDSGRPERLAGLLANEAVLKVFHHAPFDLRWMISHWQVEAASIACTKVASRLLNPDPDSRVHSLKYLLSDRLGVDVDKSERLSDWTALELTQSQIAYAAQDVVHLLPLLDLLEKELANEGLLTTYQRCLDFLPTRVLLDINGWPDVFGY